MKIRIIFGILYLIICFNLTACNLSLAKKEPSDAGSKNGDFKVSIDQGLEKGGTVKLFSTNPDTLNPLFTKNNYIKDILGLVYEGLVSIDKNGKPIPCLAESWEVSEDKLEWTFHLRKSVLWHDKMPFTSDDVVYTFETIRGTTIDSIYKANLANLAGVVATDKHTLKVKLLKPNSFTAQLLTVPIIPRHKHFGDDFTNLRSSRNMSPIGTGPFKFSSFKENSYIYLNANKDWWNGKNVKNSNLRLPYLDTIIVRIYPTLDQALKSFQIGEVDVLPARENTGNKYGYRNDLIIRSYIDRNFEFIVLNLKHPLLGNSNFRKALVYAINKSEIVNNLLPGEAVAADLPIIPDTWLYNTDIIHYVPDRVKSEKLLRKLGWINKNGILTKNKTPLVLELLVNSENKTRIKIAEYIKKQLAEIGMVIEIKPVNANMEKMAIKNKDFDMALIGCKVQSIPDLSFLYATGNLSGYSNPSVDKLLHDILVEHDEERKKILFSELKRNINEDIPYIGLYFKSRAILYNKKLKGDMSPSCFFKYGNITEWYIPGAGKQKAEQALSEESASN